MRGSSHGRRRPKTDQAYEGDPLGRAILSQTCGSFYQESGAQRVPYNDVAMNDNTSTSLQTSAARLISLIFQPMLTATYLLLVVSVIATDSMREAAFWGFLAVTVSTGGPALDLRRRVRSGGITDFSIALREQRLGPLLVAEGFTALALGSSSTGRTAGTGHYPAGRT